MKNTFYFLVLITLLSACQQTEKKERAVFEKPVAEYALAYDSAVAYTKRYDSISNAHFKGNVPIRAFTIRSTDLLEAMGISLADTVQYDHIRVYLGMDKNNKFRLLITPTKGVNIDRGIAGEDVILSGPYTRGRRGLEATTSDGQYVLDFTSPCPPTCPTSGLLNQ